MALLPLLARQGFVLLDGGLATELEANGANLNDSLWSAKLLLDSPQSIEHVHYSYLCAGADVATTASYQATIPGLMAKGLTAPQAEGMLRQSVDIARQACARFWSDPAQHQNRFKPLIATSIGPYGAYLHDGSEYLGHYGLKRDELKDFHRARLAILADSNPDLIAFESFPSQLEAEAVVELLRDHPNTTCWLSFTCRDDTRISEGTSFAAAVRAVAQSPQVLAIGVNCLAPRLVEPLLRIAKQETDKPLVAYPNSGECFDAPSNTWGQTGERAGDLDMAAPLWYQQGARLIGGCCRTTPETIRALRSALTKIHQPV